MITREERREGQGVQRPVRRDEPAVGLGEHRPGWTDQKVVEMPAALFHRRELGVRPSQQAAEGFHLLLETCSSDGERIEGQPRAGYPLRLKDEEKASRLSDGIGEEHGSGVESRASCRQIERSGALEGREARRGTPDPLLNLRLLEPQVPQAALELLEFLRALFRYPFGEG